MANQNADLVVAILDDYAGIANKHFDRIHGVQTVSFKKTLNASHDQDREELVERLLPYQMVSTMRERTPFLADVLSRLPNLRVLMTTGMRNASIDLDFASQRGITVTGTKGDRPGGRSESSALPLPPPPGHSSVVQHAWALVLGLCGRIPQDDRALRTSSTAWQSGLMIPIAGKTLGVLGLGKLGVGMAKVGVLAFGMEVVAWSENLDQKKADAAAESAGLSTGAFKAVNKEELFRQADVLAVHYVLSPRSRGIVGAKDLAHMKKTAILVNTSRGPLIHEESLIEALAEGKIGGAALDVLWEEPLPASSGWRNVDKWSKSAVVLSPHMGYVNEGTMERWYEEQAQNVERWVKGDELLNRMN